MFRRPMLIAGFALLAAIQAPGTFAQTAQPQSPCVQKPDPKRPSLRVCDVADLVQGTYVGEIISDSRGATPPPGVQIIINLTRIGRNRVQITTNTPQLPGADVSVQLASGKVVNTSGENTIFIDLAQSPWFIDYTWRQVVAFSGRRS